MDDLKISLIVPAYNVERYVGECLQSICSQTWQNWEAVVIDDGSSDGTGRICDLWQELDHRVHVYHIANGGVSAARNAALKLVTGEIVGFADADDRLPHTAFERIAGHFMQSPSLSAVFAGHRRMDESGRITETRQGKPFAGADGRAAAGMTLEQGRDSYLGVLWNKYFRRDCLIRDGQPAVFSTDYRIGEDQVWLLEVCRGLQSVEAETERFSESGAPKVYHEFKYNDKSVRKPAAPRSWRAERWWNSPGGIIPNIRQQQRSNTGTACMRPPGRNSAA